MGASRVLVHEPRAARFPGPRGAGRWGGRARRARLIARRAAALLAVVLATLLGGAIALDSYSEDRALSVGQIHLGVDPGHRGAFDVYVPLVDWGARFDSVRLPARLELDVRTIDRAAVAEVAAGRPVDVRQVLRETRDAIAGYLRALVVVVLACGAALGLLTALAVRGGAGPRLRLTGAAAVLTAAAAAAAVALLLPPRGEMASPQYYAFGPDIPRALQALEDAQRAGQVLDQELDAQLIGLARLVTSPADRATIAADRPALTIASDLHNNVIALSILERSAGGGPVLFPGDLTDRGTPLEARLIERVVETGRPFVFVSGNHDSDTLSRRLARNGAVVLTQRGRLRGDGAYGERVVRIAGLRIAGYADPTERRAADGFTDRHRGRPPSPARQARFAAWLETLEGEADVVMVHQPELAARALEELAAEPPAEPLVLVTGHTHKPSLERIGRNVTVLNGGSVGAGGTGNLAEQTSLGLARLVYDAQDGFAPLAGDLIAIDPGSGNATARRQRLDVPPSSNGDPDRGPLR